MLVALMSTPDRWPSGSPHAQIKVIVIELAARARDRAGEAGHERRFAGEEHVALVERLIDKITIPISVCSPRARGDLYEQRIKECMGISIHSPHARGDSINL